MNPKSPIYTVELFPLINQKLIEFLQRLSSSDWNKSTISPLWTVKDIAAHLLDGNLRRIAVHRDKYFAPAPSLITYPELVKYLNQLNAEWVKASQRLSPQIIIELLQSTGEEVYQLFKNLPPNKKSVFAVSWAGEKTSLSWFDIAREYTEKWLHQQQIREAFQNKEILNIKFYHPCLDTFMRALPHTYQEVFAPEDTGLKFEVTGPGGGTWYLWRHLDNWQITDDAPPQIMAQVKMTSETSWKLFSRAIKDPSQAKKNVQIKGNIEWGEKILEMVAVMA